jgi:preprotein translocase subunit YajC
MLSGLRKDTEKRYRGLMTVCALTCGLVWAMAASAMAQDTKPAQAGPTLGRVQEKPPTTTPGAAGSAGAAKSTGDANSVAGGKDKQPSQGLDMYLFAVLLGGVVLMWIWMGRGRRKQEAKRKEMLSNLKKGDKIVSIGGIIGTVIEAKPEEITVKVDETNNVRMKFARWAIRGVGEEAKTTSPDDDKK